MTVGLTPRQGAVAFMATLAGDDRDGLLELRHRRSDTGRMQQRFFPAAQPNAAAAVANVLSRTGEVFVGCALRADLGRGLRAEQTGGKSAVRHGWVLWVDCDDENAITALERFEPQPAIAVRSSGRGLHAYWPLQRPLRGGELEQANRRLAYALGACQSAVTNCAAVLRPPNTLNWKYHPPAQVVLERLTGERFDVDVVVGRLVDPPIPSPRREPARNATPRTDDPLLAIDPVVYVEQLSGRQVGRDRKVACPLHSDRNPSLHVYPDHWTCFSAKCWRGDRPNGGDIYSLAAQMWGLSTKTDFPELRRRLRQLFLPGHE